MFALTSGRAAECFRPRTPSPLRLATLATCLPLLAACAAPPDTMPSAASPQSAARPVSYAPVLSGYVPQRPAEPTARRGRNESVAPQEKAR